MDYSKAFPRYDDSMLEKIKKDIIQGIRLLNEDDCKKIYAELRERGII